MLIKCVEIYIYGRSRRWRGIRGQGLEKEGQTILSKGGGQIAHKKHRTKQRYNCASGRKWPVLLPVLCVCCCLVDENRTR